MKYFIVPHKALKLLRQFYLHLTKKVPERATLSSLHEWLFKILWFECESTRILCFLCKFLLYKVVFGHCLKYLRFYGCSYSYRSFITIWSYEKKIGIKQILEIGKNRECCNGKYCSIFLFSKSVSLSKTELIM